MSTTTETTTYCVPVCYLRIWRLKYTTIILPAVLYGCETWFVILREVQGLRVLENRVLRKIFRPKKDDVTGEWRRLHNLELQ
jgi:hypothetical protein